jgi:hypothetical protein
MPVILLAFARLLNPEFTLFGFPEQPVFNYGYCDLSSIFPCRRFFLGLLSCRVDADLEVSQKPL